MQGGPMQGNGAPQLPPGDAPVEFFTSGPGLARSPSQYPDGGPNGNQQQQPVILGPDGQPLRKRRRRRRRGRGGRQREWRGQGGPPGPEGNAGGGPSDGGSNFPSEGGGGGDDFGGGDDRGPDFDE